MAEYTQRLKNMLMLHVHYGMAGAQLCTFPGPGPRLMEQTLPETFLVAMQGARKSCCLP